MVTFLICAALMGCSVGTELADCFDKETLRAEAEAAIQLGESGDYDGLVEKFSDDLKSSLTQENYKKYMDLLSERGAFQKFGEAVYVGQHINKTDSDYAIVIMNVEYEKGNFQYAVGFNEDMELIQFSVK